MRRKEIVTVAGLMAWAGVAGTAVAADWMPVEGRIMTKWAAKVNPARPLPEYPRPQMVRPQWASLNGLWEYAIVPAEFPEGGDPKAAIRVPKVTPPPAQWDGKILVPFPIESALSGVRKPVKPDQVLWYRRTFKAPALADGRHLLLHFGAVDWACEVFVNGTSVGAHRGGYDSFGFDITETVKAGADNELTVWVYDATGGMQPRGKQNLPSMEKPGGIMYTPCSGIWQTTWLETVPAAYISRLIVTPDVDAQMAVVRAEVQGPASPDRRVTVDVQALDGSRTVASGSGKTGEAIILKLSNPKLWSPETPFLYGLKVRAGEDAVTSYFGMRKIALGKDEKGIVRPMLNGKFVFQSGPLDQGFWPDGIYTAPTDDALRFDIEITKKLGFNMARKHVKIEPARWYYWCDRLGLLVWQDMPSGRAGKGESRRGADGVRVSEDANAQFEAELRAMVEQHRHHPSIIMWVVFNEGWGQYDTVRLTEWVKELDPTRLVNNASGWTDHPCGDVIDMHNYPGPGSPKPEESRAAVLGEFGGLGLHIPGHAWTEEGWGYRGVADRTALTRKYLDLWRKVVQLRDDPGLCAAVYTQTTDVENECNGLLTYDRQIVKPNLAQAAAAAQLNVPPPPEQKTVVPTGTEKEAEWKYTTDRPADGWFKADFDAASWKSGPAGFGRGAPNSDPRTAWSTSDIWLRREIELPDRKLAAPALLVYHDEDVEIYINGVLAAKAAGYTTDYEPIELAAEGAAALKPGKNLFAVHCRQTGGGQFIDLGVVDMVEK